MTKNIFEKIKKINEHNQEYWSARELPKVLGYSEYSKFLPAKEKSKTQRSNFGLHGQRRIGYEFISRHVG